ncbi:hypothetical protein ACVW1C_000148 [Bradyrhizobium sp. USDA 4011]
MNKILILVAALCCTTITHAAPLKQMPIDFVGEWCNGEAYGGETNWKLPSWVDESENGGKCGNILSVSKYEFSMTMGKEDFSCTPDSYQVKGDTAPSGTTYVALIQSHCHTAKAGAQSMDMVGRGLPVTFQFKRYKGNIYVTIK